jgi:tetraacyldisaccharide 4'-kinase
MRTAIERTLNALWYDQRHAWLGWALKPVAGLYTVLAKRTWRSYQTARTPALAVPVVVVGNIVAGGSGKTPVTQALALALAMRGFKVGIVSRGYGGTVTAAMMVDASEPQRFGDEPCLLASTTGCPVAVARKRSDAVRLLKTMHDVDVVLSDDGMQHASLHRDFELCVVGPRGMGNGLGLPAGPLREPVSRLAKVQAILAWGQPCTAAPAATPQWVIHGAHSPLQLLSGNAAPEGSLQALAVLQKREDTRVFAAAGLAHPARFYISLAGAGLTFKTLAVADHGMLSAAQLASLPPECLLLVTEKDAVKLRQANLAAKYQRMVRIVPWRVALPAALVDTIAALMMK